jgi:gluconate 2-dehydrogenase gamma chain
MRNGENKRRQRRALLKALTAVPAAALVPLSSKGAEARGLLPGALDSSSPAPATHEHRVLNDHEWNTICVLSDLIIPADERTGSATQAGVPEFIDAWLDLWRETLLAEIRGGLTWLDIECNRLFNRDFAACLETQQKQILDRIAYPAKASLEDANAVAFFNHLRDLVVSAFFSSKMGVKDLPYLGNIMVADWEGCPPEVLSKLGFDNLTNKA